MSMATVRFVVGFTIGVFGALILASVWKQLGRVEKSLKSQRASCTPSTAASELDSAHGADCESHNRSAAYRERLPTPHDGESCLA